MWLYQDIRSLADIPRYYARRAPEQTALIGNGRRLSFAQLDAASNRIANAILAAGVEPRSHIAFLGKNSVEFFVLLFAANKAGCALLPLNWRLSAAEIADIVDDAEPALVFVDAEYAQTLAQVASRAAKPFAAVGFDSAAGAQSRLDAWLAAAPEADPRTAIRPQDTALLLYTSGTTGRPKGVQLSHEGFGYMRLCEHLEPALAWQADDVLLCVMPCFHMVGAAFSVQALYNGVPISILPALDVPQLLATIARDRPTICCLVPTAIQMLIDHPAARGADLSSLRLVWYAGSAISAKLLRRALGAMQCRFMQFYGTTESGGAISLLRPEQHDLDDETKLRSCGTPLPLVEIRVVDAGGADLPLGSTGEFLLRTPALFSGYWKQPAATAAALADGWYRTGDVGYRDAEGLCYIVDRSKDVIISGGENIYSTEVEQALIHHPAVAQVAVVGVPDERWGESVLAAVVLAEGMTVSEEALIAHCRELIAGYKVPKTVAFLTSLPVTSSGKVLKGALRQHFSRAAQR